MTPARLAALGLSLVVLFAAVYLVFIASPAVGPAASPVAQLPTPTPDNPASGVPQTATPSVEPQSPSPGTAQPQPTPVNALAKQPPPSSVEPDELTGYVWPLRRALLTSRMGPRDASLGGFVLIDGEAYHDGIDLATRCGDRIRAAHDGVVLYAGRNFDPYLGYQGDAEPIYARLESLGRTRNQPIVIVIDDGNGYRSVYVHLQRVDVEAGDQVVAGEVIGLEGATGFATGCHLHYGLIRMDGPWQEVVPRLHQFGYPPLVRERVDPLDVLAWDDEFAPARLRDRVSSPSPTT